MDSGADNGFFYTSQVMHFSSPFTVFLIYHKHLLGYGSNFYKSNWDITSELSLVNIRRIENLQPVWLRVNNPFHEALFTLNDGLVRNFDITREHYPVILDWLVNVIYTFDSINRLDSQSGHPGLRGVLAYGQRVKYIDSNYIGRGEFIQTSPTRKEMFNKNIVVYSPSELQMNTAFSKAYIIEGSGSSMGVSGNNLYIDLEVINKIVEIGNSGIRESFATVDGDPLPPAEYTYSASFTEDNGTPILCVKTICSEHTWISFRITFSQGQDYVNQKQSIVTKLYKPLSVESSLFGPPDTESYYEESTFHLNQWQSNTQK